MTTVTETKTTTQVYRVYIKASPQTIWDAITKPEWTDRYGYGGRVEYDLRPGGAHRALTSEAMRCAGAPDVAVDGEVVEAVKGGVTKLTVIHDLEGAPKLAALVGGDMEGVGAGGGWSWVLSDLKTLIETGKRLEG